MVKIMESNPHQQNNKDNEFTIPIILGIGGIFF
jgi:hypothetical protein